MCPFGGSLFGGESGPLSRTQMCAHVLLIEASDSLVLVDTGFGLDDARDPKGRLPGFFRLAVQPRPREEETALRQVEALGFSASDVRHIVPTHLDIDHAGGLPDFPDAQVHVWRPEMEACLEPTLKEKVRYERHLFSHNPKWTPHDVAGDEWMSFESVRVLEGVEPEILIIPLPGHTRGHSAVAVKNGDRWLLHCGDAYFHRGQVSTPPSCPPGLRAFQAIVGLERKRRLQNEERLRELNERSSSELAMFCAHDPHELEGLRAGAPS
jgi:glyoxylase-like metal-dependent hydrolase (beta-lactamase superfamily II)